MGAHGFTDEAFGKDVADAYAHACEQAVYEYGHDSYNGTISTTDGFIEVTRPARWSDSEFLALIDLYDDLSVDEVTHLPVLPQRRKFDSDGDRARYLADRKILTKAAKIDYIDLLRFRNALSGVEKWGPCLAWKADSKTEASVRSRTGYVGKRGGVWMFSGWAAS